MLFNTKYCDVDLLFSDSSQDYLYGQSTKSLSYNDFVNKELVLFSNSDNERSIPCLVDGMWSSCNDRLREVKSLLWCVCI